MSCAGDRAGAYNREQVQLSLPRSTRPSCTGSFASTHSTQPTFISLQ
jgi:hypothetical protein